MRKLGIIQPDAPVTEEAQKAYSKIFDKPLTKDHLDAIRALFPAASVLSDEELLTATMQAAELATA